MQKGHKGVSRLCVPFTEVTPFGQLFQEETGKSFPKRETFPVFLLELSFFFITLQPIRLFSNYSTFIDMTTETQINTDFNEYFTQGTIDTKWAWVIKHRMVSWVDSKHNQNYWAIVKFYSQWSGILIEKLSVENFAKIVVALCPEYLKKKEPIKKLTQSIYSYEHSQTFKKFNTLPPENPIKKLVYEVETLFNEPIKEIDETTILDFSVEQILRDYLTRTIAVGPLTMIHDHPTIGRYPATFSVETYMSQELLQQNRPTTTVAFMYDEEKVTEDKLNMYMGQYQKNVNKLFIVSTKGFYRDAKGVANDNKIGLLLINPESREESVKVILPRWEEQKTRNRDYRRMLCGEDIMTEPMIIDDGYRITTSLTDVLRRLDIPVKDSCLPTVPYLTDDEIEAEAMKLIQNEVDRYLRIISHCNFKDDIPRCQIDPFQLLSQQGLTIEYRNLNDKHQLGYIDFEKKVVVLNKNVEYGPRIYFSVSHELGHYRLHSQFYIPRSSNSGSYSGSMIDSDSAEHHRMEYQANRFASALLMPEPIMRCLFDIFQQKHLGVGHIGPISFGNSKRDLINYLGIVKPLARRLNVSEEAAKIRLLDLGLITDMPAKFSI